MKKDIFLKKGLIAFVLISITFIIPIAVFADPGTSLGGEASSSDLKAFSALGLTGLAQFAILLALLELVKTSEQIINMLGLRTMPSNDAFRSMFAGYGLMTQAARGIKGAANKVGKVKDRFQGTGRKTGYNDKTTKNTTATGRKVAGMTAQKQARLQGNDEALALLQQNGGKLPNGYKNLNDYMKSKEFQSAMKGHGVGAGTILGSNVSKDYKEGFKKAYEDYNVAKTKAANNERLSNKELSQLGVKNAGENSNLSSDTLKFKDGSKMKELGYKAHMYQDANGNSAVAFTDKNGNLVKGGEFGTVQAAFNKDVNNGNVIYSETKKFADQETGKTIAAIKDTELSSIASNKTYMSDDKAVYAASLEAIGRQDNGEIVLNPTYENGAWVSNKTEIPDGSDVKGRIDLKSGAVVSSYPVEQPIESKDEEINIPNQNNFAKEYFIDAGNGDEGKSNQNKPVEVMESPRNDSVENSLNGQEYKGEDSIKEKNLYDELERPANNASEVQDKLNQLCEYANDSRLNEYATEATQLADTIRSSYNKYSVNDKETIEELSTKLQGAGLSENEITTFINSCKEEGSKHVSYNNDGQDHLGNLIYGLRSDEFSRQSYDWFYSQLENKDPLALLMAREAYVDTPMNLTISGLPSYNEIINIQNENGYNVGFEDVLTKIANKAKDDELYAEMADAFFTRSPYATRDKLSKKIWEDMHNK